MRQLGASSAILDHKANAALLFMCEISVWRTKNGQLQEKKNAFCFAVAPSLIYFKAHKYFKQTLK